jgi:hypothetical protein
LKDEKKAVSKKDSKFLQNVLWTISLRENLGKNNWRGKRQVLTRMKSKMAGMTGSFHAKAKKDDSVRRDRKRVLWKLQDEKACQELIRRHLEETGINWDR